MHLHTFLPRALISHRKGKVTGVSSSVAPFLSLQCSEPVLNFLSSSFSSDAMLSPIPPNLFHLFTVLIKQPVDQSRVILHEMWMID